MEIVQIQRAGNDAFPRVNEKGFYPDVDSTYTMLSYTGERLTGFDLQSHPFGIKTWNTNMLSSGAQGIAIYDNLLIRAKSSATGHKLYRILPDNTLTELATIDINLGHGNACQFAPVIDSGQTYPYVYVAALGGVSYVLSISSTYEVTLVQTITVENGGQVLKGDDGYIWDSVYTSARHRRFTKYRKVEVSEGSEVTLTDEDILESFDGVDVHPSDTYTAQGWKVKNGKIWYCYGAGGAGKNRGIKVYDTATHRLDATIDLTNYTTNEFEDVELYDNGLIIALPGNTVYKLKF